LKKHDKIRDKYLNTQVFCDFYLRTGYIVLTNAPDFLTKWIVSLPVRSTCLGMRKPEVASDEIITVQGKCLKSRLFSISGLEPVRTRKSGTKF
jgi:hypothetical protein